LILPDLPALGFIGWQLPKNLVQYRIGDQKWRTPPKISSDQLGRWSRNLENRIGLQQISVSATFPDSAFPLESGNCPEPAIFNGCSQYKRKPT